MKALLISDMHGEMEAALKALEAEEPEVLLCAGDWGDPGAVLEEVYRQVIERAQVFTVYGNHDDLELLKRLTNRDGSPVLLCNGEIVQYGGLRLSGINGIWAKSHQQPHYVLEEEVLAAARALEDQGVDALLTHGCPVGLSDLTPHGRHGGQRCFLDALKVVRPRLYVCGHLHVPQQRSLKDGTWIINAGCTARGDYAVVEIDPERCYQTSLTRV
jgi:Icc-related predicted phosphoesterase